jgi:GT2 family glycosyltransferase
LFDEQFFLYWEEVDLCHRARAAGFDVSYVPDAAVVHLAGLTTGLHQPRNRVPRYWFESRAHFYRKTIGPRRLAAMNLAVASCVALRRTREALTGRTMNWPHYLRDFIHFNFFDGLPGREPL